MGLYSGCIGPWLINKGCSSPAVSKQRSLIVPKAEGVVLELGIGSGMNLPFYDKQKVKKVIGIDPSGIFLSQVGDSIQNTDLDIDVIQGVAENLPLEDNSVDQVLVTYTLCSVDDPFRSVEEARRVLKPEGRVLFLEHGLADEQNIVKWQDRLTPAWKTIGLGCRLNRNPIKPLQQNGFEIEEMENLFLPKTPKFTGYQYRGIARAR